MFCLPGLGTHVFPALTGCRGCQFVASLRMVYSYNIKSVYDFNISGQSFFFIIIVIIMVYGGLLTMEKRNKNSENDIV